MSGVRFALLLLAVSLLLAVAAVAQSDFTVVLLPDTQYYAETYPHIFNAQTQWIANNKAAQNIQLVLMLGDVVNTPSNTYEWQNADASTKILDNANIPYFVAIGNHDYDGLAPTQRKTTLFNQYFGLQRYAGKPWLGTSSYPPGSSENYYGIVTLGGQQFLILVLEYAPRDAALEWADTVLTANANKKVIVVTHSYEYSDNTRVDLCDTNDMTNKGHNGDWVWNNFLSQFANIIMVVNGHLTTGAGHGRSVDLGASGNLVNEMLSDYQGYANGGNGWLRVLKFHPSTNQINVLTYSPYLNSYLTGSADQFNLWYTNPGSPAGPATIWGRARVARIGSGSDCSAISGVTITAGGVSTTTDATGHYSLTVNAPAAYTVTAAKPGYTSQTMTVHAWNGFPADVEFFLNPQKGYMTGYAKNSSGVGVYGASVKIANSLYGKTVTTNSSGYYSSGAIPTGTYTVSVSLTGHATQSKTATVYNGSTTTVSFSNF